MEYGRLGKTAQEDLGTEEYADSLYKVRDSDVSEDPFWGLLSYNIIALFS